MKLSAASSGFSSPFSKRAPFQGFSVCKSLASSVKVCLEPLRKGHGSAKCFVLEKTGGVASYGVHCIPPAACQRLPPRYALHPQEATRAGPRGCAHSFCSSLVPWRRQEQQGPLSGPLGDCQVGPSQFSPPSGGEVPSHSAHPWGPTSRKVPGDWGCLWVPGQPTFCKGQRGRLWRLGGQVVPITATQLHHRHCVNQRVAVIR